VVTWGGAPLFALCPACYPGRPMIIEERPGSDGGRAVYVGFLHERDKPADIILVKDLSQLNEFIPKKALSRYQKMELLPDEE